MEDSIFTKIVAGEIPAHKVYENDTTLAFLDIFPKHEGHVLVIPKVNPAEFVWDLDDAIYLEIMETVKKVAVHLRDKLPYEYVYESVVGTDVPYAHVHLIPFDHTSDIKHEQPTDQEPDHNALAELAKLLYFED